MKAREIIDYLYETHPSLRDAEMAELLARAERAETALAARDAELAKMDVSLARARRAWQESEEAAKLWQRIALAARESIDTPATAATFVAAMAKLEQEPQP